MKFDVRATSSCSSMNFTPWWVLAVQKVRSTRPTSSSRPWPVASERPPRARRYVLAVRRGVVVRATQTSSGALARPDASRHLLALCRCVDALGRCGVDTSAARVHAWVDDAMSGTRDAPVAHLVAVEPLGHDDDDLAAALGAGPELVYKAVEAE